MITSIITILVCLGTVAVVGTVVGVVTKYGAVNPLTRARNAKKERLARKMSKEKSQNPNAVKKMLKKLYKNRLHCAKMGFMTPESTEINSKTFSNKRLNKNERKRQKYNAKMKLAELNEKQEKVVKYENKLDDILPVKTTKYSYVETKKVGGYNVEFNSNTIYCNSEYAQNAFKESLKQKSDDSNYPRVVEVFSGENRMALLRSTNDIVFKNSLTNILAEAYVSAQEAESKGESIDFSLADFNFGSEDGKKAIKTSKRKMHTDEYNKSEEIKKCATEHYAIEKEDFESAVSAIQKEFEPKTKVEEDSEFLDFI